MTRSALLGALLVAGFLFGPAARAIETASGFEMPDPFASQGNYNGGSPINAQLSGLGAVAPYGTFDAPTIGFAAWEKFSSGSFEDLAAQYTGSSGALHATLSQATETIGVTSTGTSNSGRITVDGVDYFGRLTCGLDDSYNFSITATSSIAITSITLAIKHSNFFDAADPEDSSTWTQIAPFSATLDGVPSSAAVWSGPYGNFSDAIALNTTARYYLYSWNVDIAPGEEFTVDFSSAPETLGLGFSVDAVALSVQSVPEPATGALAGLGLAALLWQARRRRRSTPPASLALLGALLLAGMARPASAGETRDLWLDLYRGEEVDETTLLDDLATAGVIYIGEIHTIERHHEAQAALLAELAKQGRPLALGLEQIEARDQPAVDRFNRGELDFEGLAEAIQWPKQWKNYEQYRPLCEIARKNGIPLRALNAPAGIIRAIGRGGLAALPAGERAQLPKDIVTDDPAYEKLMNLMLAVHMSMAPDKLRPVFEAQVARDETMAENIARAMRDHDGTARAVVVICGRGHVNYGLGTPDRVRRRVPDAVQRILLVTESGELVLNAREKAMARDVDIRHEDLRALGRPLADYLQIHPRASAPAERKQP